MGGNPINLSDATNFNTMISQTRLIDFGGGWRKMEVSSLGLILDLGEQALWKG